MSTRKSGLMKGTSSESNNRKKSEMIITWESFVNAATNIAEEVLEIFVIFCQWLSSWWTIFFDSTEKDAIIKWLRTRLPEVPSDFSESWRDGILLCILLESLNPGSCPRPDLLDRDQGYRNVSKALEIIEHFEISPGITAEEIVSCSQNSSTKLISLLFKLKRKTESFSSKGANGKENLPLKRPPEVQACFAKGTGLVVGFLHRSARFTIFFDSVHDLDIVIEIKGPGNITCCERITMRSPKRKKAVAKPSHKIKLNQLGRSTSLNEEWVEKSIGEDNSTENIQLEYELKDDRISVGYTPIQTGVHKVTILWHGQHVPGSPYRVNVEDTFEKYNVSKSIHLRPSLRNTAHSKTDNSVKQANKSRKPSVRFKDSEIEQKEWGKITKRKILRYIVKLNGKEVAIDADRSDLLAPALLKLDYEMENELPCHRRNSWGFVGDVERKKSFVRQFCVDLDNNEMCGTQRRSSSFHLAYNSDSKQALSLVDNNEDGKSYLRTVTEGSDKGFREEDNDIFYYENSMPEYESFILVSEKANNQMLQRVKNDDKQTNCLDSAKHKEYDREVQSVNKTEAARNRFKKKYFLTKLANQNTSFENKSTPEINRDSKRKIGHCATLLYNSKYRSSHKKNIILNQISCNEQILTKAKNMNQNVIRKNTQSTIKNTLSRRKRALISAGKKNKCRLQSFIRVGHKFPNDEKFCKSMILANKKGPEIPKSYLHSFAKSHIHSSLKKVNTRKKQQYLLSKIPSTVIDLNLSAESKLITKLKSFNQSQSERPELKHKNKPVMQANSKLKCYLPDISLKSPHVLKDIEKCKVIANDSIYFSEHRATSMPEIKDSTYFSDEKKKKVTSLACVLNSTNTLPTESSEDIISDFSSSFVVDNLDSNKSLNIIPSSTNKEIDTHDSIESLHINNDYFENKKLFTGTKDANTNFDKPSSCYSTPDFIFRHFKDRGKSFSRLSLRHSVKDIVKDYERHISPISSQDAVRDKNLYSRSLNFPPLAVNEDRIRVKNRIMQWETVSLPSNFFRRKDSYKESQEKEKIAVLADVLSKTAFWETAYNAKPLEIGNKKKRPESKKSVTSSSNSKILETCLKRDEENNLSEYHLGNSSRRNNISQEFHNKVSNFNGSKFQWICTHHLKHRAKKKLNLRKIHFDRRWSDPGPIHQSTNTNLELLTKFTLSNYEMGKIDSVSSVGGLCSSTAFSQLDDKDDSGDEYIDDEIPDYAAMFWDDYISNAGLLFDSRSNWLTPDVEEVKVFGGGVYYGHVSVKNHFQVLTKGAGKGHLAVSVQGSSLHDVTNVSVTYTRKDVYDVIYQVIEPGYYLISVKWSDTAVPGSPFVCKVTY